LNSRTPICFNYTDIPVNNVHTSKHCVNKRSQAVGHLSVKIYQR